MEEEEKMKNAIIRTYIEYSGEELTMAAPSVLHLCNSDFAVVSVHRYRSDKDWLYVSR